MIKRLALLLVITNVSFVYAIIGGVGVNVVNDSFTLEGRTFDGPGDIGSIERTEIGAPIGVGAFAYLTIVPFVDFEASAHVTGSPYDYTYQDLSGNNEKMTLPFGKFSWSLSVQKPVLKIPTIRMYIGGGVNKASFTKIVTPQNMESLDPEQLNDIEYINDNLSTSSSGFHIELGARFKPPIIPFSINTNARYNFIDGVIPGENGYLTISAGMAFAI